MSREQADQMLRALGRMKKMTIASITRGWTPQTGGQCLPPETRAGLSKLKNQSTARGQRFRETRSSSRSTQAPRCPGGDRKSPSVSPIRRQDFMDIGLGSLDFNVRRPRRIVYSSEEEDLPPPCEPTTTCLGPWNQRLVEVNKYVDDNLQEEGINFENADHEERDGQAIPSQNLFGYVVRRAEERGMKVNTKKTPLISQNVLGIRLMSENIIIDFKNVTAKYPQN